MAEDTTEDALSTGQEEKPTRKRKRRRTASQKAATKRNLAQGRSAIATRRKKSGRARPKSRKKRTHRKSTRRRKARLTRSSDVVGPKFGGSGSSSSGGFVNLALPTPGFTPVPIISRGAPARQGDAGARAPSLNGSTIMGVLMVPRATDGRVVDTRQLTFAIRSR